MITHSSPIILSNKAHISFNLPDTHRLGLWSQPVSHFLILALSYSVFQQDNTFSQGSLSTFQQKFVQIWLNNQARWSILYESYFTLRFAETIF